MDGHWERLRPAAGFLILFVAIAVVLLFVPVLFEAVGILMTGWATYLPKNLTFARTHWDIILTGLSCFVLGTLMLHQFLAWIARAQSKPWKFTSTLLLGVLIVAMFATAVSMAGIVHQLGWLATSKLTEVNRGLGEVGGRRLEEQLLIVLSQMEIPGASDQELRDEWALLNREYLRDIKRPRSLWLIRNETGELTTFLLVPRTWDETIKQGFLVAPREGEWQERPGPEITQWLKGRRVIQ